MDFQARLTALVAAHILAHRPLKWAQLVERDVPIAVSVETGGSGDDLRVELAGTSVLYECQAKRGLSADTRLDDAIRLFAAGMPARPEELGFLLVDPRSARTVTETLHDDLEARRQGLDPQLKGPLERVITVLRETGAEGIVTRLYVRMLDVEQDTSPAANNAVLILDRVLANPEQASAAWSALIAEGLRMCREGGRRDFDALVARLAQDDIYLVDTGRGTGHKLNILQDQVRAGTEQVVRELDQLKALVTNLNIVTPPSPLASEEDRFTIQLDSARQLIEKGRAQAGLDFLRALSSDLNQAAQTTRVRFHNLLGAALLHLDRIAEAEEELSRVLEISPDDLTALSNLAQAASMAGNADKALRYADRVIAKDPLNVGAWVVTVQRRPNTVTPAPIADHPAILTAIGFRESVAGHWESAIDHLRRALDQGFEPERALFLAQALYARTFEGINVSGGEELLFEARRLLDQVCAGLEGRTDSSVLERALITRGQIENFRGNEVSADADFSEAAKLFPESPHAAYHLSTSYLKRGELDKALYTVERLPRSRFNAQTHMLRARVLVEIGRKSEVRDALEQAINQRDSHGQAGVDLTLALAEIAIDADLVDLAQALLAEFGLGTNWLVDLLRARLAARLGDFDAAREHYQAAVEASQGESQREVRVEFGAVLSKQGDLQAALEQFEYAEADRGDEFARERYARALYKKGELTRASSLLEVAEGDGITSMWALELGYLIAARRNDPATEASYLERMLAREPGDIDTAIHLAAALIRQGKRDRVPALLEHLRMRSDLVGRHLIQVAELHLEAGQGEQALPLAYRAVRLEPDDPQIQMAFLNVFLHREGQERKLDPDTVRSDTYVTLEGPRDEQLAYLILSEGPVDIRRNEFLASDTRVAELLGKGVGETVVFRAGSLAESSYRVTDIKHAIVHAFQDTMLHFNQRNPDNTSLQRFHVGPDPTKEDFAFLFASLEESRERGNRILSLYREQQMPLGFIARLLGRKIPDVYAALVGLRGELLFVEFPDLSTFHTAVQLAGSSVRLLVTRSALLTIRELGLSELLSTRYADLSVPQSLVDELEGEVRELRLSVHDGRKTMLAVEGGFAMHEEEPERTQRAYDERRDVLAWVRANCHVLPLPFEAATEEADTWRERIGASSYDSYMLSISEGIPLLTDDLGLRQLALVAHQQRATGFSTIALLAAAADSGDLSPLEFHRHSARLIRLNHTHVPVSADILFVALVDVDFDLDEQTIPLFDRLRAAHSEYRSAVSVVAELLQKVTLSPKEATITAVANLCLECLADGHPQPETFRLLLHTVRQRLSLLPNARLAGACQGE